MKTVWKWIIGIVIALVVVAALVAGGFFIWMHFGNFAGVARAIRPGTQMPGFGRQPFSNNAWGVHGTIMRGPGMMGYGRTSIFRGLFGGLISLGLLILIVMAIIWLARSLRTPARANAVVTPVASATSSVAEGEQTSPAVATHPCPKCGEPVQDGWKHCPHCGKKQ